MKIKTINPTTEQIIALYSLLTDSQVNILIDAAHNSYQSWRKTDFTDRRKLMLNLSALLREKKEYYATLMAQEMGKPVTAGKVELEKCVLVCEHYAEHAESYLASRLIDTEMKKTKVCYQPLGIVFAIMPWNFPFWQVFRFAAPTIMAGNAAILKHAPISTGTGNAIAQLFLDAGFPDYLFQHFILDNDGASAVIAHENIVAVTLTGSERAGRTVAANAGSHLKKVVLELGGNDAYLILADADLDLAADCVVASRMNNTGQVCIAAKRIIVAQDVINEFVEKIINNIKKYQMGDPLDPSCNFGPMAREDLRDLLQQQVLESIRKGAKLLLGGEIPKRKGYYYPMTILTDVRPGMPAFDDELFGPVIAIVTAKDEADAIRLANQSKYGLGAAVFTRDLVRGEQIATDEIETGTCFVNGFVASDPRVPFGGIKCSGFGRELSREGILEFVNVKTVAISEKK